MLFAFIVLAAIVMTAVLCVHHNMLRTQLRSATVHERQVVRRAAEQSIIAANTVHPVVALTEMTRALEAVEGLHRKYGTTKTSDLTGVDTARMLTVLQNQYDSILQDLVETDPKFALDHPLASHAGYATGDAPLA